MSEPIVRSTLLSAFTDYLQSRGIDPDAMLKRAVFESRLVTASKREVSLNVLGELFEFAARETEDDRFGFEFAGWLEPGHFGLLEHLLLSAPDINSAMRVVADYVEVTICPMQITFELSAGAAVLEGAFAPDFTAPSEQFADFLVALLVRRLGHADERNWRPGHVAIPRRPPADPAAHEELLGRTIEFDADRFRIAVSREVLDTPMPQVWPGLHETLLANADIALQEVQARSDFVNQVQRAIAERLLREETVRLQAVAASLHMTARALQWRLEQRGTTFDTILANVRCNTALTLLRDSSHSMSEIARKLGFSEGSAFTRWSGKQFGMSPSAYRRSLRI